MRGGGGNFGIVTRFEFTLHPLGPVIYAGPIFYPAQEAFDLLRAFRDWAAESPDEVTALLTVAEGDSRLLQGDEPVAADASTGRAYVHFLGDTAEARTSYGEATYARLVALKNQYDPTNFFRLNQNVEPSSPEPRYHDLMAQSLDAGGGSPPPPFAPQHTSLSVPQARRSSVASGQTDQLTRLVYELLDAHADTEQLSRTGQPELLWQAHLDYLRDLQRVAREVLARVG